MEGGLHRGNPWVTLTLIAIIVVFGAFGLACHQYWPVKVLTGSRYVCCESDCHKEYKSTVKEIRVPRKDAKNYQVKIISSSPCPACTVSVQDGEQVICPECNKVIKDTVKTLKVAKSQTKKHHVEKKQKLCAECKEEAEKLGPKDPIDREIVRGLRERNRQRFRHAGIIYPLKDIDYVAHGVIDERVLQLLIHLADSGHSIAVRLKEGYDDNAHMLSRETRYENPSDRNISAHWKGQAIDIFIADDVEIVWQTSANPIKRQKAQEKIRQLIREIFNIGRQSPEFLLPTQMGVYRQEDVEYFANDIRTLYGPTQADRGRSGLGWSYAIADRIHIGY